jgi:1-phosphofructokinase family hexose kinase
MLIVNPNFTVDRTIPLAELVPGDVIRTGRAVVTLGGKGVNVARVARAFGDRATLVGFLPRAGRATLDALSAAEGVELTGVEVEGELRAASVLLEAGGRVTVLNEPGAEVGRSDWVSLLAAIERQAAEHATVVCAGSLPPGSPADGYARVVAAARRAGARVVVDAAGEVLRAALAARPDVVSPNLAEAESLISGRLVEGVEPAGADVPERARRAAEDLLARGARHAIVSAGSRGAAAAAAGADADAGEGAAFLAAPAVTVANPIGAGDSLVGGLVHALEAGRDWRPAAAFALATASASCEQELAGGIDSARVRELDHRSRDA